ncbi:MAG TPA: hypothetical protein VH092_35715 [Urbifossiella sp.]|jgi:hypothetical protein|nr:hypothetical protein [Urbifossiella sp.]
MVTTTFAAVMLSAALANEAVAAPAWETSYARAAETAIAQRKPLAVFIGRGEAGYTRVVGGDMPTDAGRLLASNYVALYVNTDTADGKTLATAFGVSEGLVISCRGCQVQALKYGGSVPAMDLAGYLTKYSATNVTVNTTERAGTAVVAAPAAVVGGCANGRCGTVYPAGYSPNYFPGTSSCPTGRCPYAR